MNRYRSVGGCGRNKNVDILKYAELLQVNRKNVVTSAKINDRTTTHFRREIGVSPVFIGKKEVWPHGRYNVTNVTSKCREAFCLMSASSQRRVTLYWRTSDEWPCSRKSARKATRSKGVHASVWPSVNTRYFNLSHANNSSDRTIFFHTFPAFKTGRNTLSETCGTHQSLSVVSKSWIKKTAVKAKRQWHTTGQLQFSVKEKSNAKISLCRVHRPTDRHQQTWARP